MDRHQMPRAAKTASGQNGELRSLGRASQGRQLLPQGQVLQDQLSMSTARQRQRSDDDEQLQHASMVAAVAARFNTGRVLARVKAIFPLPSKSSGRLPAGGAA